MYNKLLQDRVRKQMKEAPTNTSINSEEYVEELKATDVDMVIYRMIGGLAEKLLINNI